MYQITHSLTKDTVNGNGSKCSTNINKWIKKATFAGNKAEPPSLKLTFTILVTKGICGFKRNTSSNDSSLML